MPPEINLPLSDVIALKERMNNSIKAKTIDPLVREFLRREDQEIGLEPLSPITTEYGTVGNEDVKQLIWEIVNQVVFEAQEEGYSVPKQISDEIANYVLSNFLVHPDARTSFSREAESLPILQAETFGEAYFNPTLIAAVEVINNSLPNVIDDYEREFDRFPDAYLRDQKISIIGRQAQQRGHLDPRERNQSDVWVKNIVNNWDRWNEAVDTVATEGIRDYEIIADRIFESEEPSLIGWKDIGKPVMDLDVAEANAKGAEALYEKYVNKINDTVTDFYKGQLPDDLITPEQKDARDELIAQVKLDLSRPFQLMMENRERTGISDEQIALAMEAHYNNAIKDSAQKIQDIQERKAVEKDRKERLDAVKDASGARKVLENELNTILGVNGYKDLPDYAMDIMTTDILSSGMNANMTGSPLPDVSTIIAPYLGSLDGWRNEKQTQSFLNDPGLINQVAKNALGINESTDPEIKSILESRAIPQLSEQIQNILASNPSMGYTPNYISQDLMQTHGVTPTGEFKPFDMGVGLLQSLGIDIPQQIEHVSPLTFDMPQGVQNVANMLRNMSATDIVSQQLDPSRPPGMGGQAIVDTLGGVEPIGGRGVMKMPTLSDYASQLMPSLQANISDITPEFAQYLSQADIEGETPLARLLREYQASQQIPDLPSDMLQAAIGAEERAAARRFTPERVISDFVMPTPGQIAPSGFDDPFSIRQSMVPSAVIPGKPLDPRGIPYYGQATAAVGDIFRSQLPSPEEFLETGMPQLRQGFEASPFFTQQEERIASEREAEEAFAQREADIAERERRVALRPTATSIFGRRQ